MDRILQQRQASPDPKLRNPSHFLRKPKCPEYCLKKVLNSWGHYTFQALAGNLQCEQDLNALNSDVSRCNYSNDMSACDNACRRLSGGAPAGCSSSELENARIRGQQEVVRDLTASATLQGTLVYGRSQEECTARSVQDISVKNNEVISQCNAKTTVIRNCQLASNPKTVVSPATAPSVAGNASVSFKAKRVPEEECRTNAVTVANQDALNRCKAAVGFDCTLDTSRPPIINSKVKKNPFGDDKRECYATVYALPPADVKFQCQSEIRAQNVIGAALRN